MEHAPKSITPEEIDRQQAEYERREAEWERQLPEGVFDLEKLGPDRLAVLFEALGELAAPSGEVKKAREVAKEESTPGAGRVADELIQILGKELKKIVEQDSGGALRLFWQLVEKDNYWPKAEALHQIAKPFARQYAENLDPVARSHFLHKWAELLLDEDGLVREAADMTLAQGNIKREWLDEETIAILNDHASEWWS